MPVNLSNVRRCLQAFDFKSLFIEELGWDRHQVTINVDVDGQSFALRAVAEKRGLQVFECPAPNSRGVPNYSARGKIERQVTKAAYEHIIIYTDAEQTIQTWQWVKREPGRPLARREHHYYNGQPGDALIQKIRHLAVDLAEEDGITLPAVAGRVRRAFDVDRVTKRFYDHFKTEHAAFLKFVKNIPAESDREWYASLMLNRLMFVYFIQKKGYLDGDSNYLRGRLAQVRERKGKGKFLPFYRFFLLRLFHEGLGRPPAHREKDFEELLGKIPYLNGGLFDVHDLEKTHTGIDIPDEAFERLFNFFDQYQWHLDERPLRADNEINPDVLGYIFEKYINQKQMGAYYTKEDITGYIARNTIIPFLFDATEKKCPAAFKPGGALWKLLADDPDRYIYEPVRRGVVDEKGKIIPESALPDFVQKGMADPKKRMFDRRYNLGEADLADTCGTKLTLPTETWREYAARRRRCLELREKLKAGHIHSINDLITYNLDICQFAEDAIENSEEPEVLRAFWQAIERVSVLDPTCGSGAFLFAALNILEPLYDACLDRMQAFLDDLARSAGHGGPSAERDRDVKRSAGEKHRPEKLADFRKTLEQVSKHPNRRYYILKSIVVNNLYGVDIMEEAVEICKLRLFLKLVAQVDDPRQIEPLPDIDFNIRPGNTLVGYASLDQIQTMEDGTLSLFPEQIKRIEEDAELVDRAFKKFHEMQTEHDMDAAQFAAAKIELRKRLNKLRTEIDHLLAKDYGVDVDKPKLLEKWRSSHLPFHWFAEFYGIMCGGGFDVIIGNPPYLESREIDYELRGFACLESAAIHAMCVERGTRLLHRRGCMSMIVPLALPSTQRMKVLQDILEKDRMAWYANFAWRPGKLFDTVNRALTIFVVMPPVGEEHTYSTGYQKWTSEDREDIFGRVRYVEVPRDRPAFWIPKLGSEVEWSILKKCMGVRTVISNFTGRTDYRVYYRTDGGLYWKVFTNFAPKFKLNGRLGHSSRETWFTVAKQKHVESIIAALSSDVFWWWYTVTSNLRHLNPYDVQNFPLPEAILSDSDIYRLGRDYLKDIDRESTMLVREQKQTGRTETQSFKIQESKPLIDEIDSVLAKHYGFTDEELDFIVNYDIKYRMGQEDADEG